MTLIPPQTNVRVQEPESTILENNGPIAALETKVVIIGCDGSFWNLAGNYAGKEGLTLAPHIVGFMHAPFASLYSEGPYEIGGHYERTDYKKRTINMGVMVGVDIGPTTSFRYRMLEQRWWRAWSPKKDTFMGCWTRTHGWRWLRLRMGEEPKTPIELDPVAFDNNFMQWDMVVVAAWPYWAKKAYTALPGIPGPVGPTWKNTAATATNWETVQYMLENLINQFLGDVLKGAGGPLQPGKDVGMGHIKMWNNSDVEQWPTFQVSSPGRAWIEDGPGSGNMIPLPLLTDQDGTILVDTNPTNQTLTAATDPYDPLFFQILRNSQFVDVFLHDFAVSTEPVWKRFKYRFQVPAPPNTLCNYKVYHTNHDAVITGRMAQHFQMAYG